MDRQTAQKIHDSLLIAHGKAQTHSEKASIGSDEHISVSTEFGRNEALGLDVLKHAAKLAKETKTQLLIKGTKDAGVMILFRDDPKTMFHGS